jgi:hypothetical protein
MWPFVYGKMVFHKLTMVWVYSKSYRASRADKFANLIVYAALGPFIAIGNTLVDTYYFVRHCLNFDLQKIKHKTTHSIIKKDSLKLIRKIFNEK